MPVEAGDEAQAVAVGGDEPAGVAFVVAAQPIRGRGGATGLAAVLVLLLLLVLGLLLSRHPGFGGLNHRAIQIDDGMHSQLGPGDLIYSLGVKCL